MSRHTRAPILVLLAFGLPFAADGQTPTPTISGTPISVAAPKLGTRVRLTVQNAERPIAGRLGRLTADSIELYEDRTGIPVMIARGEVERVERREKRESALSANGILGGTLGLAGSGYALWRLCRDGTDCWTPPPRDENDDEDEHPMSVGVASLVTGAALGALMGYAMTPYGWRVTVLPYTLGARGQPPVKGLQVAVNFTVR